MSEKNTEILFSIVITTKNEEKSITPLLDSLVKQSLKPTEIIIVDAQSTDQTINVLHSWDKSHQQIKLQLIEAGAVNRSRGRNQGITAAANEWIAVTDAGCMADNDWLKELATASGLQQENEVVGGFYLPITRTIIERCFAWFTATDPQDLNAKGFLPSSRSIAFTKKAWKKVGGYPEHLTTCEDLVFARSLRSSTKMVINPRAIVYWHPPKSFGAFFKAIAGYARGDMEARYRPHMQRIHTIWLRYFFFIWVPWLFVLYPLFPIFKFRKKLRRVSRHRLEYLIVLPIVQVVADMGVLLGSARGLLGAKR
jgi:glycosyltransferase involved in cell wall biosynthesis